MKDNFVLIKLVILITFSNICNIAYANQLIFDTENIKISNNGEITTAENGTVKLIDENIVIEGDKFIYDNLNKLLEVENSKIFLDDYSTAINSKKILLDEKNSTIKASGNILIDYDQSNYELYSEEIIYNINKKIIHSGTKSKILDKTGNKILTDSFSFDLKNNIVKINNINLTDILSNNYLIEKAFINLKSKSLVGKDVFIKLDEKNDNYFRLKGKSIVHEKEKSIFEKAILTPCKINDSCPPWQLKAEKISHDKKKKIINYNNVWLEIYNQPVLYFPKFFHPDPTVERQSGFLMPSIISSNTAGNSFEAPYFHIISETKDFTLKPRLFDNNKILGQTEYRSVAKDFEHISDLSILSDKYKSHRSHYFSKTTKTVNSDSFDISQINLNIQQVSNDFYLKEYSLESPIIDEDNLLENTLSFQALSENLSLDAEIAVYENLNKGTSDRYEYLFPSYNLSNRLQISDNMNGDLFINSSGNIRNYNTNVNEKILINDLLFNSNDIIVGSFKNNFNLVAKNVNSDSKHSSSYKENSDINLNFLAQFNSELPLIKENQNNKSFLTPKISLKLNPSKTKNKKSDIRTINNDNIFDLDRLSMIDSLEGGESLTYGLTYKYQNSEGRDLLKTNIANVIRLKEEKNISKSSSLGNKTSDIFTSTSYNPNDILNLRYDLSLDQNLDDKKNQLFEASLNINQFVTSFEYLNQTSEYSNESYLSSNIAYNFNDQNQITFKTRDNKKDNITEFYNLVYRYRNDCLEAAIEYNKEYYSFGSVKPEEKLFFKITIVPFGETKGPNLYR
jgi:LPS-assembly protein